MTNTIYFNLDNASYSTSSPDSILSQQQGQEGSGQLENNSIVFSKASSSVVVTAGAINALIRPPSWRNREQVRKPDQDFSSNTSPSEGEISPSSNLKSFSFKELNTATNNFSPDYVLEEGGFGKVFKGWINEHKLTATKPGWGTAVSIKRLRQESSQGRKKLLKEINFLGQLCHPNLVKLLGYCLDHEERLLVYEFMPRGGLENHLFRSDSCFQLLSWNLRMKFALGAAKGLAFIHGAERKVIYGDLKTSNILLDWNYNAKLSDFGLADGPTGDKRHVSTWVMGTYGYAAPEYLATGHLTAKSDVYSFGVVLLEMLSGFRAVDKNGPPGEHGLVEWVKPYLNHKRKISRVLDRRLKGKYPLAGAQKAAKLALRCLSMEAKFRPNMDEVVKALEELQDSKYTKKCPI